MVLLEKNVVMSGDLMHSCLSNRDGFVRLKHENFVVSALSSPMTLSCIIDNRVINSDNMGATIEFTIKYNLVKDNDNKQACRIEMRTPSDANDLNIEINLVNWHGAMPMMNLPAPVVMTKLMPIFNLNTGGQIFIDMLLRGIDSTDAVDVNVNFWYGKSTSKTEETTDSKQS